MCGLAKHLPSAAAEVTWGLVGHCGGHSLKEILLLFMLLCQKTLPLLRNKSLEQVGGLFLAFFYHFIHSNIPCPSTSSPFTFVYLQNRPKNSCGMEHPQTKSWTVPETVLSINHCSNKQFCKVFALSWSPDIPFVPKGCDSLSADPTAGCSIPSSPLGMQGLSVCCSEQSRTCYISPALFILPTYKLIFVYLKFPSVGSGSLSKSPLFHRVLMDICSLETSVLNGPC